MDDPPASLLPESASKVQPQEKPTTTPAIGRAAQDRIGEQLQAMYDSLKAEPIPARFLDLLQQLEKPDPGENP